MMMKCHCQNVSVELFSTALFMVSVRMEERRNNGLTYFLFCALFALLLFCLVLGERLEA